MTGSGSDDNLDASSSSRRPIILAAAAVVVVAVLIGIVLALARDDRRAEPGPTSPPASTAASPDSSSAAASASSTRTDRATPASSTAASGSADSSSRASRPPSASAAAQSTRSAVPLKTPAEVKAGLTARISDIEAVDGEATSPGEIAGPAVRFTLTLANASDAEVPLETTVVNVYYGKARTPASPLSEGAAPLPARVAAGDEVTGTYVYVIPRKSRERVLITVDHSVDVSLVAFEGSMPAR